MSVDNGPDQAQKLLEAGHVKTTANGFIFTRQGLNFLGASLAELFYLLDTHQHTNDSVGSESGEGDKV
jgi:hypothetical protein